MPSSAIRSPPPTASQASSTSRCCTIDLEPAASRRPRWSSSTTGRPQRASISAAVCPTGPLPRTATSGPGRASEVIQPAARPPVKGEWGGGWGLAALSSSPIGPLWALLRLAMHPVDGRSRRHRPPRHALSALQLGPDLAVALGGPDPRPLDPGQFVPQPGGVERHAVLEDRPAPVPLHQRRVRALERLLERAATLAHRAD